MLTIVFDMLALPLTEALNEADNDGEKFTANGVVPNGMEKFRILMKASSEATSVTLNSRLPVPLNSKANTVESVTRQYTFLSDKSIS